MEGKFLMLLEDEKQTLQLRQRLVASVSLACCRIFLQVEMIHELGSLPFSFCS